jgi:hypothetical protein
MHLHHPSLSLNGKKRGKVKFRNAEEAKKSRELDESWKQLQTKWAVEAEDKKRRRALAAEPLVYTLSGRETTRMPSRDTGHKGAVRTKDIPQYTGTKILGVTIVHKSCLQPVFNQQEAIDAATMRR